MPPSLTDSTFYLYQTYIKKKCGIEINHNKKYLIETRLTGLIKELGASSFEELFLKILNSVNPLITEKLINSITTNETMWFRDKKPWDVLKQVLLPQYIEQLIRGEKSKIRIWSAASSTGQEAYSTAICIYDYLEENKLKDIGPKSFEIIATDISSEALVIADKGLYDSSSVMRGLNSTYLEKYFTKNVDFSWKIDYKIKSMVKFQKFNLQDHFYIFGRFDVIFLRNVLIYFCDDLKKNILEKTRESLEPNGVIFLGTSEYYPLIEQYYTPINFNESYYYKK